MTAMDVTMFHTTKVIITGSYIIKSQAVCHIPQLQSYEVRAYSLHPQKMCDRTWQREPGFWLYS